MPHQTTRCLRAAVQWKSSAASRGYALTTVREDNRTIAVAELCQIREEIAPLSDTNAAPGAGYYRVQVDLP